MLIKIPTCTLLARSELLLKSKSAVVCYSSRFLILLNCRDGFSKIQFLTNYNTYYIFMCSIFQTLVRFVNSMHVHWLHIISKRRFIKNITIIIIFFLVTVYAHDWAYVFTECTYKLKNHIKVWNILNNIWPILYLLSIYLYIRAFFCMVSMDNFKNKYYNAGGHTVITDKIYKHAQLYADDWASVRGWN